MCFHSDLEGKMEHRSMRKSGAKKEAVPATLLGHQRDERVLKSRQGLMECSRMVERLSLPLNG